MAGLVGYASSDEGDEEEVQEKLTAKAPIPPTPNAQLHEDDGQAATTGKDDSTMREPSPTPATLAEQEPIVGPVKQNAIPLGPSLPPVEESLESFNGEAASAYVPLSPYSANRALLWDLTLPSVPNMDIPPSPPGSPMTGANKKFEQFLELKKKGVHFNAKLEQSEALRNPSLMDKLLDFVEVDQKSQYSTTLSTDLWDATELPEWAFREKLKKSHEKITKELEMEKSKDGRTTVDFVPSTRPTSGNNANVGGLSRGEKRKGGWK